jgi:DNA segregation ATPase FtsK/SpoIIIE-like protein
MIGTAYLHEMVSRDTPHFFKFYVINYYLVALHTIANPHLLTPLTPQEAFGRRDCCFLHFPPG